MVRLKVNKRFEIRDHHVLSQRVVVQACPYIIDIQKLIENNLGDSGKEYIHFIAYSQMRQILEELVAGGLKGFDLLDAATTFFKESGYGELDLSALTNRGGNVIVVESYFAMGWYSRYGFRKKPVCHFIRGFLTALMEVAFNVPPEKCTVVESKCFASNLENCCFHIEV